jgi:hypothetical protein
MQRHENMICEICGKENGNKHQDYCVDLGCSGRMIPPRGKTAPVAEVPCSAGVRPFADQDSRYLLQLLTELAGRISLFGGKCSDEVYRSHDAAKRELEFRLDKLDFIEKKT